MGVLRAHRIVPDQVKAHLLRNGTDALRARPVLYPLEIHPYFPQSLDS